MYNRATSQRLLYTLFITQSMFSAAQIAIFTLVAIVAVRLAADESVAGLPSSAVTFSQALAAYPFAVLMGRFGRRLGLALGYAVGVVGAGIGVLAVAQEAFPLLLISAALLGVARGSIEQGRFAAGELFPEAERARMIGRLVFAGTIGAVAGPALVAPSGRLLESLGLNVDMGPWIVALLLNLCSAVIIFFLLRPDPSTIAQTLQKAKNDQPEQSVRPMAILLSLPKVQLAIIAAVVSQTVMVVLMVMTPLHMDHLHHSRDNISFVISMHTLGMFGFSAVTGYLIDRFGRIPMLVTGALIMITAALIAPISPSEFVLSLALFLLGLGWNFGYVSASSLLADALQGAERIRVQGINDSLVFLAAGFGSLASGPLFASRGYAGVSIAGIVLTFVLIGMIIWLGRPQTEIKVKAT